MGKFTGLLNGVKATFGLVDTIDYENGYVKEVYQDARGNVREVDIFENKARVVRIPGESETYRDGKVQRFKA